MAAAVSIGRPVLLDRIWQPIVQGIRFHRRPNIQKPRPPHYEKARIFEFCKPIYAPKQDKFIPLSLKCEKKKEDNFFKIGVDNPYENLIAKQITKLFNESKLIAIFHFNSCDAEDRYFMNIRFKREGMRFTNYGKKVLQLALGGTKYETILDLFTCQQALVFCPEPKVEQLLKTCKKAPYLILMAGIIEGQYASVSQIQEYSRLKDITTARAQLVSVLNSAGQNIVQNLNQHQTTLVSHLDQYVDIKKTENVTEPLPLHEETKPSEESA